MGYKIFISSTMDDLQKERHKIAHEVTRSANIPIMAENMFDVINTPRKALEKKVDECNGYIGVFHKKWGYVPTNDNPDKLSVTAIEYEIARERNMPRLILVSNYKKEDELENFIEKISNMHEGILRYKYADFNDMILQVARGIPYIIDAIKSKHSKTQALDGISSSISPSISSPNEIIEDKITDSSE
jgi:hypothetical protein